MGVEQFRKLREMQYHHESQGRIPLIPRCRMGQRKHVKPGNASKKGTQVIRQVYRVRMAGRGQIKNERPRDEMALVQRPLMRKKDKPVQLTLMCRKMICQETHELITICRRPLVLCPLQRSQKQRKDSERKRVVLTNHLATSRA